MASLFLQIPAVSARDIAGAHGNPSSDHWTMAASSSPIVFPIPLRVGDKITGYTLYVKKGTASTNTITADIFHSDDSTGGTGTEGSESVSSSSNADHPGTILTLGVATSIIIASNRQYYLKFTPGGSNLPAPDSLYFLDIAYESVSPGYVTPEQFGAVGDGVNDDLAAFNSAVSAAKGMGGFAALKLTGGKTYKISKAIVIEEVSGFEVWGNNAEVSFPSDDGNVTQTDTEHSYSNLRSAFYLRSAQNCTFRNLRCRGTGTNITVPHGSGAAFYLRRCVNTTLDHCEHQDGGSLILQDTVADSAAGAGTRDLTFSGGLVTVSDSNAAFHAGMVGLSINISGSANSANDGNYLITSVGSSSSLTYANAGGVTETGSSVRWTINDGDRGTKVRSCHSRYPRNFCKGGNDTVFQGCLFEWPTVDADHCGFPDSFSLTGSTVTLTDTAGRFKPSHHGKYIRIAGAANFPGGNNIGPTANVTKAKVTYISATQISYTNATGANETAPSGCTWFIMNGDKVGLGAGAGSIALNKTTTSITITASSGTYHRTTGSWLTDGFVAGGVITTTGFVNGPNNTTRIISTVTANDIVVTNNAGLVNETATATAWNNLITFTAASATFSSVDVGAALRICDASNAGNNMAGTIEVVTNSTVVQVHNAAGVNESYSGVFTVNSYDNTTDSMSNTNGSTHGMYFDSGTTGRHNIKVIGCTFRGNRTCAIKISGSTNPLSDFEIVGNSFYECGTVLIFGADDSNEHTGLSFLDNYMEDCATQRPGWGQGGEALTIYGSRNVNINRPRFHYTRDSIGSVDGNGFSNNKMISASRKTDGISQPVEDIIIDGAHATVDPAACTVSGASKIAPTMIALTDVGQCNKWNTGATLAINGTTVTLTDNSAKFVDSQDIGKTVTIFNAANSNNNGPFTVTAVSGTTLQWTNPIGANGGAGTYRLPGRRNDGVCIVRNVVNEHAATVTITTNTCVAPQIYNITSVGIQGTVRFTGDCMPSYYDSIAYSPSTMNPLIVINSSGTSWPLIYNNSIANEAMGMSAGRDQGIGIVIPPTRVDYPLLGKTVRCLPTNAQEEVVVAYGSKHVDGDTITVAGTTYTFKQVSPGAGQFNTFASLLALITGSVTAADYGASFAAGSVATQHIRIRKTTQTTSDGTFTVTVNALNPTALVLLRNDSSSNTSCKSRGSGSAGPTPDKIVMWSQACQWTGVTAVVPDNTDARTILQAGGPALPLKNSNDAGCNEVILVGSTTGKSPEFRVSTS